MAIKFDDIMKHTEMVTVSFGQLGDLNVEYYPAVLTAPERYAEFTQLSECGEPNEHRKLFARWLAPVLAWWDLYERDSQPLPITIDALEKLPMSVLTSIMQAIADKQSGNGGVKVAQSQR